MISVMSNQTTKNSDVSFPSRNNEWVFFAAFADFLRDLWGPRLLNSYIQERKCRCINDSRNKKIRAGSMKSMREKESQGSPSLISAAVFRVIITTVPRAHKLLQIQYVSVFQVVLSRQLKADG